MMGKSGRQLNLWQILYISIIQTAYCPAQRLKGSLSTVDFSVRWSRRGEDDGDSTFVVMCHKGD